MIGFSSHLRQEAITAAIGEKDAHIALLELNRKNPKACEELKGLKKEKDALVQQLKDEVSLASWHTRAVFGQTGPLSLSARIQTFVGFTEPAISLDTAFMYYSPLYIH